MTTRNIKCKAFTLIELSIVLVIIGLIVGGVLVGRDMIFAAQLRKVVSDVDKIRTATNTFKLKYNALPGDIPNASTFWSGERNGNGDGLIGADANSAGAGSSETGVFFLHLALAGLVSGNYTPGNVLKDTPAMAMSSMGKDDRFIATSYTMLNASPINRNHIASRKENTIRFGSYKSPQTHTNTHEGEPLFSVEDVYALDVKIDDGKARSGQVSGHNPYLNWNSGPNTNNSVGCLSFGGASTSTANGDASYNLGSGYLCNISFDF